MIETLRTIVVKRWPTTALSILLVGLALVGLTTPNERQERSRVIVDEAIQLSDADLAAWEAATATDEQREQIVADLQAAFAGVAQVGLTDPANVAKQDLTVDSEPLEIQPIVAFGASARHVWITASYADVARGAIWAGVRYCISRGVPSWLCNTAGNRLNEWARGWGAASNHGVWIEIFWAPPHVRGGRW